MKNMIYALFMAIPMPSALAQGLLKETLKVESTILGTEVAYSIYLPEGYDTSDRRYPVLYLLHGYTDDETGWTQFGQVKTIADRYANDTSVSPMLIVMPDAGETWYINSHDGKTRYEDFFVKEFIPFIDKNYNTRPAKEFRAISGLSMGGYGALVYALKHPDLFSASAPLSAAVFTGKEWTEMKQKQWDDVFGELFGMGLIGEDRLTSHYSANAPLLWIKNKKAEELDQVKYYIDCGDKDFLIKGNMELHALMIDKDVPHEFRVREGDHSWSYWRSALPEVLKFVSQGFHR